MITWVQICHGWLIPFNIFGVDIRSSSTPYIAVSVIRGMFYDWHEILVLEW